MPSRQGGTEETHHDQGRSTVFGFPDRNAFDSYLEVRLKSLEWTIYLKILMAVTWVLLAVMYVVIFTRGRH